MLKIYASRVFANVVPRVRAQWPAIGAIALAVVLTNSGIAHLDPPAELVEHYRFAVGDEAWVRGIGILQLLAAGGLCFGRTRVMTAAGFAAILLLGIGNQFATQRAGSGTASSVLLLVWTVVIAWGEMRQARSVPGA